MSEKAVARISQLVVTPVLESITVVIEQRALGRKVGEHTANVSIREMPARWRAAFGNFEVDDDRIITRIPLLLATTSQHPNG